MKGYLSIILHAHLPYIRHKKEGELAEEWLYEAITETYIPLLNIMTRLTEKGVNFRLTISISPTLLEMLTDDLLQERYRRHLEKLIELSEKEVQRTGDQPEFNRVAQMYRYLFKESYHIYAEQYGGNLLNGFKELQKQGVLEIITSAATHGYLPLMYTEEAVNAQIENGIRTYENHFGQRPRGIWLPECAFSPEIDPILSRHNLRYFISSTHGVLHAEPRPRYGIYAPIYTPGGVAAFGRDMESSKQVWSADEGYPGDYNYREFYRDIGHDLDYNYVKPYLPSGIQKHTGIKYYKITGKTDHKEVYNPDAAREKAAEHAGNFMFNRQHQFRYLSQVMDRNPVVIAPYDAELFGHWWFEGPQWLEFLLEKLHYDQEEIETITPSDYLEIYPDNQISMPSESSWGYKGYHEVWLNGSNDWIYRHLHEAEYKMKDLAEKYGHLQNRENIIYTALNQLARELLLAQSSDWAFIIKADTMVEYARKRTENHLENFFKLARAIENGDINGDYLEQLKEKNNIFPFLDFKSYKKADINISKETSPAYK
ncbi:MAG: glycoside hydrolase family 57 protein [Halanaerobiaceae bacterium]